MSDPFESQPPVLDGERFRLRALSMDDIPSVFAYASNPNLARYTLWPAHESEETTRRFLQMLTGSRILSWAIEMHGGPVVGTVFLHSLNRHHRKAEIAFNLAESHWGRGIATRAAALAVGFAFSDLGLNRVEATCMSANTASRRVLERLGMTHEGRMRRSHRGHDGFHDMELFSLLCDDRAPAS